MQVVMRNFRVYLAVEVVLFFISLLVLVWAVPGCFYKPEMFSSSLYNIESI